MPVIKFKCEECSKNIHIGHDLCTTKVFHQMFGTWHDDMRYSVFTKILPISAPREAPCPKCGTVSTTVRF